VAAVATGLTCAAAATRENTGKVKAKAGVEISGVAIGESVEAVKGKVARKEMLVGPSKGLVDSTSNLEATTYRYTGSFDRDPGVTSTMLYFSAKGTLAGLDLFLKNESAYGAYQRVMPRRGFEKVSDTEFRAAVDGGTFDGAETTAKFRSTDAKKKRERQYSVEIRCLDILRRENSEVGPAGR
jgi:hypothetical protein